MDPFADLIELLRPKVILFRRVEASDRWGLAFHKHDDLLFCTVAEGGCLLLRGDDAPLRLGTGDLVLVRTDAPFVLASDHETEPVDSEKTFVAQTEVLRIGDDAANAPKTTLLGGRFVFDSANEALLTGLLPPVLHVRSDASRALRIQSLLRMNIEESQAREPGRDFVLARLMELVLVEVLRDRSAGAAAVAHKGLLAGLADPVTAVALRAMHGNIVHGWTVEELARLAGVSRSSFAARVRRRLGTGPIEYLQQWRMAVARDQLRRGHRTVSEIAFAVGFESVSAFSTAFTRSVGCPPSQFRLRAADSGKTSLPADRPHSG